VLPKGALRCFQCNLVPSKEALQALPKIAVAVPPKRALDLRRFLQFEKHGQGELEVLPKRVLTCFQSMNGL